MTYTWEKIILMGTMRRLLVGTMRRQFITSRKFVTATDVARGWLRAFIANVLRLGATTNFIVVGSMMDNPVIQFN